MVTSPFLMLVDADAPGALRGGTRFPVLARRPSSPVGNSISYVLSRRPGNRKRPRPSWTSSFTPGVPSSVVGCSSRRSLFLLPSRTAGLTIAPRWLLVSRGLAPPAPGRTQIPEALTMPETKARVDALIEKLGDLSADVRLEAIEELGNVDKDHALPACTGPSRTSSTRKSATPPATPTSASQGCRNQCRAVRTRQRPTRRAR